MTVKQRVVIIPGDQAEEGIDGYGGKDFEKRKVLGRDKREKGIDGYVVKNFERTVRWYV